MACAPQSLPGGVIEPSRRDDVAQRLPDPAAPELCGVIPGAPACRADEYGAVQRSNGRNSLRKGWRTGGNAAAGEQSRPARSCGGSGIGGRHTARQCPCVGRTSCEPSSRQELLYTRRLRLRRMQAIVRHTPSCAIPASCTTWRECQRHATSRRARDRAHARPGSARVGSAHHPPSSPKTAGQVFP